MEKIFASTSNKKYIKISDTCSVNNLGGVLVGMFVWSTVKFCTCVLSKLRKINPKNKLNILEFISNRFFYQITMRELSPFPMLNGIEYTLSDCYREEWWKQINLDLNLVVIILVWYFHQIPWRFKLVKSSQLYNVLLKKYWFAVTDLNCLKWVATFFVISKIFHYKFHI